MSHSFRAGRLSRSGWRVKPNLCRSCAMLWPGRYRTQV